MYDTVEEARMRLTGTVIFYRGTPKYVRDCVAGLGGEIMLHMDNLPNMNGGIAISIRDPDVNMRDFRSSVGYMNNITVDGGASYKAHYVMRMPIRGDGFKQGLHNSNLAFPRIGGERQRWDRALTSPSFKDMLMGVYPSIEECKVILDGDQTQHSVAFNRTFALAKDHELGFFILNYKGRRVASGDIEALTLPSHNWYLNDVLRQSGIKVR
jgi:hypothetical protein